MKGFVTSFSGGKYWAETTDFSDERDYMHVVNFYPEVKYQEVDGFGGAITEASGYCYSNLSDSLKREFIESYYGKDGLMYNTGRFHINSCDFALGNYACADEEMWKKGEFSLERDEKYLIPVIKAATEKIKAESGNEITLLLSPWSPPAFMKTNGEMNHGGKLKEEYAHDWAKYIARFIKEYKNRGVGIALLSVQNEPEAVQTWDSCIYIGEEERDFVKNHLGPVLKEEGLTDTKILIWDHNKEVLYDRSKVVYDDAAASEFVYGTAFHWYTGDHFDSIRMVRETWPEKKLYFTEGCVEYSRFADSSDVGKAEMYAHDILGNLQAGTNGYFDWNLLLDAKGGPNHVGNFCAAPVMCNEDFTALEKKLSYYYIGHFSRYIKKGAVRVATTRYADEVETVGFVNPDGSKVLVLLNRSDKDLKVSVREGSEFNTTTLKAHSIETLVW
ncbi:MAG: glucosylceramidase [Lachnospiraceae bacterium]|nr:glucosylceramidase [Lachnospiraceae bacterium]